MAQPLPRFEELGVRVGQVPPISSAGAEAAARTGQVLVENLNRLTSFAFEEANKQAAAEGLEYGAANAPTAQQIKDAADKGEPPPMPGDQSTTFGRAARQGALAAMKQSMEVEARNKIAELHATARQTEMTPQAYQKAMQDVIDGYGTAAAKVSPATALGVRASLSTMASSQFIAHSDWYLTKQQAKQKIQYIGGIDTLINGVEQDIAAGDTVANTPNGQSVLTVQQRLDLKRVQITNLAAAVNDPDLLKTKLKEFNERVEKAQTAYISTWTQGSDGVPTQDRYTQVMTGKFQPPTSGDPEQDAKTMRAQRMWQSMTPEQRTNVQTEVRRQMKAAFELESAIETTKERQRKEQQANNRVDFMKAWAVNDPEAQQIALQKMETLHDAEGFEKYSKLVGEQRSYTEPGLLFKLDNEIIRGTLTSERVATLVGERRLSDSDARALLPKIEGAQDKALQTAMANVKSRLGYPDRGLISPSADQRRAEQQVQAIHASLLEKQRNAIMSGKTVDYWSEAQKLIEAQLNSGPSQKDLAAAEAQINGLRRQLNLPETATLDNVRDALSKSVADKKFNANAATTYYQSIDMLKKQGGE